MTRAAIDLGVALPGESAISVTGTTIATAYPLRRQETVFSTVASGAIALLPSLYPSGTRLRVLNRGANSLAISPGSNRIEANGTGTTVAILPLEDTTFISFDPPSANTPRTWWQTNTGTGAVLSGPSAGRPTSVVTGEPYFDTDLGLPIWWNGTAWVNATGAPV